MNSIRPTVPHLVVNAHSWCRLHRDLARRGQGRRESGAFLLAREGQRRVRAWVAFDDLDPGCLTGGISFSATGFSNLWDLCERYRLVVAADVHTHPFDRVDQSAIDQANPMIAQAGHIALITPHYAQRTPRADQVGVHLLLGRQRWHRVPGRARSEVLRIGQLTWPARPVGRPATKRDMNPRTPPHRRSS